MRYKLFQKIIYIFISMFALTQYVLAGPDLPPPPHAKLGILSEGMVVNGIPMDIRQFRSELSPERVLNFYRHHWPRGTEEQPGYTGEEHQR